MNLARVVKCNIGQLFQILRVVKTTLVPNWPRSNLKCFFYKIMQKFFFLVLHCFPANYDGYNGYMVR